MKQITAWEDGIVNVGMVLPEISNVIIVPHFLCIYECVFIDSEINRDPSRRSAGELPDSSIVPDLWIEANATITMILNGRVLFEELVPPEGGLNAGDALLQKGINRLVLICSGGEEEIWVNAWLVTKFGEAVPGIGTRLTLD